MTLLYTSNDAANGFDALATGAIATGWTAKIGTWQVGATHPQNGHAHSFVSTSAADGDVVLLTGIAAVADVDVVLCAYQNTNGSAPGLIVRGDGAWQNGYVLVLNQAGTGWSCDIFKRVSGSYTQLTHLPPIPNTTPGQPLMVRFQALGTTLRARGWTTDQTEPTSWATSITDSSVTAAGSVGVYDCHHAGSANGTLAPFTDFIVSSLAANAVTINPPPAVAAGGTMLLSGTCAGTAPAAMDVAFDGGGFVALSGFSASGNIWSGSATAPGTAGLHTATVCDHTTTTVTASSSAFTASIVTETIAVATAATQTEGTAMTVSGTYAAGPPVALDYAVDGGAWVAAGSPVISGGAFSFAITAPAAGAHMVSVRDHTNTGVAGTSASFATTAAATAAITINNLAAMHTEFSSIAFTGTYAGPVPSGVSFAFDGGTGFVAGTAFSASGGTWTATATLPAYGSHTVTVQEADNTAVTATSGSFTLVVAPNNPAFRYSPYTWFVTGATARTINAGAYFSIMFTGTSCALTFNTSNMITPASEIWWRVDGPEGIWTKSSVAGTIALAIPAATAGNADIPYHLLEVVVKSTTETQNRWNAGNGTQLVFTGIAVDNGASLAMPGGAPLNLLFYGDSITEGIRTVGEAATNDTDRNDAMAGWAFRLGALLGAEVGIVGFGRQGLVTTGNGNVPVFPSTWNLLYSGAARGFSPVPDAVIINQGTNDGAGANTVSAMVAALNGIIGACPGSRIIVLRPFNGFQAANLQAAIAACANPAICHYIDTSGVFDATKGIDGLNLHPSGPNDLGLVAPRLAALLRPILAGGQAPGFHGGFQRGLLG